MNGLALCAGVGGLEKGLKLALGEQYRTVCYVEREAYCAAVLVARMADKALDRAPIWDDLATFSGKRWRNRVDLISAGFPCQPASQAGRRQGRDDDRWLWPLVYKIICEVGPRIVFLENVRGLLSVDRGFAFGDLLSGLASLGFNAEWGVFLASETGSPQTRQRLFILAYPQCGGLRGNPRTTSSQKETMWDGTDRNRTQCLSESMGDFKWPPPPENDRAWEQIFADRPSLAPFIQPQFCGVADGFSPRVDRLRAAGNGVVPQQAALAFRELWRRMNEVDLPPVGRNPSE